MRMCVQAVQCAQCVFQLFASMRTCISGKIELAILSLLPVTGTPLLGCCARATGSLGLLRWALAPGAAFGKLFDQVGVECAVASLLRLIGRCFMSCGCACGCACGLVTGPKTPLENSNI